MNDPSNTVRPAHPSRDGKVYFVSDRLFSTLPFKTSFGHRRAFRSIGHLLMNVLFGVRFITWQERETLPVGPPLPLLWGRPIDTLLKTTKRIPKVREAFCRHFSGNGYEIGAGNRPTIVPETCTVTYIDKFTFDEAADGSFVGLKASANFVHVTHYEAMDDLSSIRDASADFFIACHVIEHVPDVIGAIVKVCQKLKSQKDLFLVIPHKEHTFDKPRDVTPLAHFIEDYESEVAPTLDHYLEYSRLCRHDENWEEMGPELHERGADCHMHVFTPESTAELLTYLKDQGHIADFEIKVPDHVVHMVEFYAMIRSV